MQENLVIVESPAKAKTIEKFLGKDYMVKSSFGHIRDLAKKGLGIDIENEFEPVYEIPEDKRKVVDELSRLSREVKTVWLASDEDREGEAIAWHLAKVLNLPIDRTKRIVFHEITQRAILTAIENPRSIDLNLVNAQQARRVLDRLVGFELSPVLWKKVRPALSAGRVQSVAVRLIVERERDIINFNTSAQYRVVGQFYSSEDASKTLFKATLSQAFATRQEAEAFLQSCVGERFTISKAEEKPVQRFAAPPFTTSTLQQEAGRKLGMSVSQIMSVAQKLYEQGLITYMRTDSVNLSQMAITQCKNEITRLFGAKYSYPHNFKTKTKGAQEAHEAIRPSYIERQEIEGTAAEKRLYELIWKRTVASQMVPAELDRTTIVVDMSKRSEQFVAQGEVVRFDGFMRLYSESVDEDAQNESEGGILPKMEVGDTVISTTITAMERYSVAPTRYNEAALVKRLEELGIGRPSTYAPTISTIQKRGYVEKKDIQGEVRNYKVLTLKKNKITEKIGKENIGNEKGKLVPTDIGVLVNRFLLQYFDNIIDYNFTANVEKEFDKIAEGECKWNSMISDFYKDFHKQIEDTSDNSGKFSGEKLLGVDPASGKNVYVKIGRFGPVAQIGDTDSEEKPKFAGLNKNQSIETITLEEVLDLFAFPRNLGEYEGSEIQVAIGRFGPYVKHNNVFYGLTKLDDPAMVSYERAIDIIESKRKADLDNVVSTYPENEDLKVLKGRFGIYISFNKQNYKIPKTYDATNLTYQDCMDIINDPNNASKKRGKKS